MGSYYRAVIIVKKSTKNKFWKLLQATGWSHILCCQETCHGQKKIDKIYTLNTQIATALIITSKSTKQGEVEATGSTFCAVKKLVENMVKIDKILHIGYTNGYHSDQKEGDKNNFCNLLLQATRWYHIRAVKKLLMDRRK